MGYTAKIVAARCSESTFLGIIGTQHIDGRIERKIVFGCPIVSHRTPEECDTIVNVPDMTPEQLRELGILFAEHGDELTEEIVLEAARSPDSYLHSLFEWDDAKAARNYRKTWAGEQDN
jgi:hypothetical protein